MVHEHVPVSDEPGLGRVRVTSVVHVDQIAATQTACAQGAVEEAVDRLGNTRSNFLVVQEPVSPENGRGRKSSRIFGELFGVQHERGPVSTDVIVIGAFLCHAGVVVDGTDHLVEVLVDLCREDVDLLRNLVQLIHDDRQIAGLENVGDSEDFRDHTEMFVPSLDSLKCIID